MQPKIPEKNKKPGICYAVTDDGLELPVIDVTNPAFEVSPDENELNVLIQKYLQNVGDTEKAPAFLRELIFRFMRRRSVIMRGLMGSDGTFLSGMNTYMLKLGPDNLNKGYFSNIDRRITESPAGIFARLRLQDISRLLADDLAVRLSADKKAALHMLNIGSGPAIDGINALIVLQKEHPGLLDGRQVFIHSLDLDNAGPNFGARALAALQGENGPLHGLDVHFGHIPYDWSKPETLRDFLNSLDGQNIFAASSEGALFEYGSDEEVTGNLRVLSDVTPGDTIVTGSVTRGDELGRKVNSGSRAALQFRGLEAFSALALGAGWKVETSMDRPLSHDVLMKKGLEYDLHP